MTSAQPTRSQRGMSTMLSPRKVIRREHEAYEPRFGSEFAHRVTRGSWVVVIGAWVMTIALVALFVGGATVFILTRSMSSVSEAVYAGFGGIAVGFVVNAIGTQLRSAPIKDMSERIIAFDPKVTPAGAARLIRSPQLYDRWTAQHPGFVA